MSRGRKPAKVSLGSDWKQIYKSSVGYYLQSIIVELALRSSLENGCEPKRKLKLRNSLPKVEESEKPFEIPNSWDWYRLGELCDYGSSSKAEPKNLNDSTWVLDLEDIEKDTSALLTKVRFEERNSLSTKSVFRKGDVLYSKLRPYLDKVIVADEDGVCTTEILPLSFSEDINPNFLLLTLKLRSFLNYVSGVTKGMKMPRLGTKEGRMALIPLPSLSEQNKVLSFLKDLENNSLRTDVVYLNKAVEQRIINLHKSQLTGSHISIELNHQLALVKELRQAYLREAMQGKLVSQDSTDEPAEILLEKIKAEKERLVAEKKIKRDKPLPPIKTEEIPFEIPSNWTWCRLIEISELKSGNQYKYAPSDNGVMYVKVGDMNLEGNEYEIKTSSNYFDQNEIKERDLIPLRSIIFPKRGGAIATNKRRVVAEEPILVDSNTMAVTPSQNVNFDYFLHWFNTIDLSQTGNENIIPQVNNKDLEPLMIPLPPLAEQERIVAKLEKLMKFCDELEANIRQGIANADSLLQTALKEALEPKDNQSLENYAA